MVRNIENNKYKRRKAGFTFRKGFGMKDYIARMTVNVVIFLIAYLPKYATPRHREDAQWLQSFALVMMIWFTALHTLAYVPAAIFGSFEEFKSAVFGRLGYAYENWSEY